MREILALSFKKILRTNQVVLLFIFLVCVLLLYFSFYTGEFSSNLKLLSISISYACLLLTGGQLKDEIERGYLDIILHRISRRKIVLGKFLSVFIFSFVTYLFIFLALIISLAISQKFEEFNILLKILVKSLLVTVYLISVGLFLSLYARGYFNFAVVFFLQIGSTVAMEFLDLLENLKNGSSSALFFLSLLSPHLSFISDKIFVFAGLLLFSLIFLLLTIEFFKNMEIKRD